ncbi:amino acid racemase [Candidatus Acetothermia bacterium]|nr:amino acid racemase [Candidatus Acetothermia bacterium]MBI3642671.1 amino acid racemase [Candidatus Acetothermia bacterium]
MKRLGIVGGTGPESTIEYYRLLQAKYRERVPDGSSPHLVINSINLQGMLDLVAANRLAELADFLAAEVNRLAAAGADFGLLAANLPHIVFDAVQSRSKIPMISIVEATFERAKALRLKTLGLFGARFTMGGDFYPRLSSKYAIKIVVPELSEQNYIHEKYFGELMRGSVVEETRRGLLAITDQMIQRDQIDGLILGGTELSLILKEPSHHGIPFLDTTKIHVDAAINTMLEQKGD